MRISCKLLAAEYYQLVKFPNAENRYFTDMQFLEQIPWKSKQKKLHIEQAVYSLFQLANNNLDFFYKTLKDEFRNITPVEKYLLKVKIIYAVYSKMSVEEKNILHLAVLLHDGYYINNNDFNPQHPEWGATLVKEMLRKYEIPADIIEKVSDLVLWHGSMNDLGGRFLIKDITGIKQELFKSLLVLDFIDSVDTKGEKEKLNDLSMAGIDHLIKNYLNFDLNRFDLAGFYKYRLHNLVAPFFLRIEQGQYNRLLNKFDLLPGNIKQIIIDSLNNKLRFGFHVLTSDIYHILLKERKDLDIFFKVLYIISLPGITNEEYTINPDPKDNLFVKKQEIKNEILNTVISSLENVSYQQIAEQMSTLQTVAGIKFKLIGKNDYLVRIN